MPRVKSNTKLLYIIILVLAVTALILCTVISNIWGFNSTKRSYRVIHDDQDYSHPFPKWISLTDVALEFLSRIHNFINFLMLENQGEKLRAMTYNIRYDNPKDGVYNWTLRAPGVIAVINQIDPDIFGLQEVLNNQLLDISSNLTNYSWWGVGRTDGTTKGEYNPIFFKNDKFLLIERGVFWLSLTPYVPGSKFPGAGSPRLVTWGLFAPSKNGKQDPSRKHFYFFNTHLDDRSGAAREYAAGMIIERVQTIAGSTPSILTGDLNSDYMAPSYVILTSPFGYNYLTDASSIFAPVEKSVGDMSLVELIPTFTGIDDQYSKTIDFVMVKGMTPISSEVITTMHRGSNGDILHISDHYPVVAQVYV